MEDCLDLKILNLKCTNCGASLEIHTDMDRFHCGYCGSEQVVERRGGTVVLRKVVDAIGRVQIGTDRTAAELALVRIDKEIAEIMSEWNREMVRFNSSNSSTSQPAVIGIVLTAVLGFLSFAGLGAMETLDLSAAIPLVFVGALCVILFVMCIRKNNDAGKQYAIKRAELWRPYGEKLMELESKKAKHRELIDH
jgi:ribosomal protein S27AE